MTEVILCLMLTCCRHSCESLLHKNKYYFCTLLKDIISMSCTSTSALNAALFFFSYSSRGSLKSYAVIIFDFHY